ncbi:MAG: tetratricopeptide repeat protein [Candidatus Hodarchaeota archaeon]
MSDSSRKETLKQINELLLQAEEEESNNLNNAIEILKKAEKISLDKELREIKGEIYNKLGEIYHFAADFQKTKEEVLNYFQLSISYFKKASSEFKELGIEEKINASLGFFNLIKYISETDEDKEGFLLESAKKHFKTAKKIYQANGNSIDSLKMAILECRSLDLLIGEKSLRIDEQADFMSLFLEFKNLTSKIWNKIEKHPDLSQIYIYHFLFCITEFGIWSISYLPVEESIKRQFINDTYKKIEKLIDIFEKTKNILIIFSLYSICSLYSLWIGIFIVYNQFEQRKYLKIAQKWIKKGGKLLPNINLNSILVLYHFMRFASAIFLIYLGYFTRDFKRVMDDLNLFLNITPIFYPKLTIVISILFTSGIFIMGALNRSTPDNQRIDFAKRALGLIELITAEIPLVSNPDYKLVESVTNIALCSAYAILGNSIKDITEKSKHLQISSKIFNDFSYYDYKIMKITGIFGIYLSFCRTGIILAKDALKKPEKLNYYHKIIDLLLESKKMIYPFFHIENLFLIGDIYYKMGKLTNDDKIFKQSYLAYNEAIEYCKNKGYFNLVGSAYVNLAQIEDRLGNFLSAAENYKKAIDSFDKAILTLTYSKAGKKIEKLKNYVNAWNIIEVAKSYHAKEDHSNAQLNYEQASQILKNVKEYKFEAPFYSAWAILEKAEDLSKKNKHQEAAATYLSSKSYFEEATQTLNSYLGKRRATEDLDRISKLIQAAKVRESYCTARHQIETARLESKKGNHSHAAELYNKSGTLFENLCQTFRIKREKDELTAVFYLCKAWENMERADIEKKSILYAKAAELFKKASEFFVENKMKNLSLGNSLYCSAIECGSSFDECTELQEKINYYKKIKIYLREASKNYQLGGFKQDAQWALGTSTYFDGLWHLIQSDTELDHSKKNQYLNIATNYLNNALDIFGKAGYEQRREEILNYLKMIKDEKAILTSALNLIEKPDVSASSIGISAPACPVEISSSVNIEEMQRTDLQTESEMNWQKRIHHIYLFMPNGTCIYDHPFKLEEEIEPQLVAGGLTGISGLIQEITKNKTKIKIVEQEEMTILLEYGKYLNIALITEENLITLRNKLVKLIEEVEDFYQEELETYSGNIGIFSKAGKFIQKIFEN